MKIVLTGSIGNIGKPLTQLLVKNDQDVTVVTSNAGRKSDIEALGAKAAVGSMEDAAFLTETFTGTDIAYVMETLGTGTKAFFDHSVDVIEAITQIGRNYKKAIEQSGVKKIVHLSSIGADKGPGLLRFHYNVENILRELPADVSIKFMRPVGFYYTMFAFIPTIKASGTIISNYAGSEKNPWVSPLDIAAVIAEEMEQPFEGRPVRYIASDHFSGNEIAAALGNAIGNPNVQWVTISDEQFLQGLLTAGMNPETAKGFVEMNAARRTDLYNDYYAHEPVLGKVKLADFAKEFAAVYNQQ